ncbi:forespore capture DNA-binding protein RefZ [Tuberibacillus calidus]|uniref:forespore capture DNA-binding protein RefZ n=1 Tax=Tuberibacillus calidus TaxID=340097 RepID=UPI00041BBAD1|nr:forespore capture DNA-binding protein RefZ [Tuberibacillus calidus]
MKAKTGGKKQMTKKLIAKAAARLFHMYGYHGTSVRNIAEEAGVNAALVSYYFGGKKALLEYLMESFYEGYLRVMEETLTAETDRRPEELLVILAENLIRYQLDHFDLSLFVHREVTTDSTLVRELMATYLMKEKYMYEIIFESAHETIPLVPTDLFILQYRNMIIMPFLQPLYLRQVHTLEPTAEVFLNRYLAMVKEWVDHMLTPVVQ